MRRRTQLCVMVVCGAAALWAGAPRASPAQRDARFDTLARESLSRIAGTLSIPGLRANVEVIRDRWGLAHI